MFWRRFRRHGDSHRCEREHRHGWYRARSWIPRHVFTILQDWFPGHVDLARRFRLLSVHVGRRRRFGITHGSSSSSSSSSSSMPSLRKQRKKHETMWRSIDRSIDTPQSRRIPNTRVLETPM